MNYQLILFFTLIDGLFVCFQTIQTKQNYQIISQSHQIKKKFLPSFNSTIFFLNIFFSFWNCSFNIEMDNNILMNGNRIKLYLSLSCICQKWNLPNKINIGSTIANSCTQKNLKCVQLLIMFYLLSSN